MRKVTIAQLNAKIEASELFSTMTFTECQKNNLTFSQILVCKDVRLTISSKLFSSKKHVLDFLLFYKLLYIVYYFS